MGSPSSSAAFQRAASAALPRGFTGSGNLFFHLGVDADPPDRGSLDGVWLAMGCDSASLPPHVGFVFEWIQEIDPELVKIAHVAGHDRQPMHQGRRGDHGILQQGV